VVPDVNETEVVSLGRAGEAFHARLATGDELRARRVVVATGTTYLAYVPDCFATLGAEAVSHTSQHRELSEFRGRDVTVVGAGQSALETAALLHEHDANVRLLVRGSRLAWNADPSPEAMNIVDRLRCPTAPLCGCGYRCLFHSYGAGAFHYLPRRRRVATVASSFGPAGAWWLKPRVLDQFEVRLDTTVVGCSRANDRVVLSVDDATGGRGRVETEHVIVGTGYRVDVTALPFLEPELCASVRTNSGVPALSRGFESSAPGLYFVGLAAAESFGPAMRFVYGADFTARRLARNLARDARRAAAPSIEATA
jgi:hypothetical protein